MPIKVRPSSGLSKASLFLVGACAFPQLVDLGLLLAWLEVTANNYLKLAASSWATAIKICLIKLKFG